MPPTQPIPPPLPTYQDLATLTTREREVLALVGQFLSNDEIARTLHRSPKTIHFHLNRIIRKIKTVNRAHMAQAALAYGISPQPA